MQMNFENFKLILTCEHASNALPKGVCLDVSQEILQSHRGYDIGAFEVYEKLCEYLNPDFCSAGKYSRLLVDLNRRLKNKNALSELAVSYHLEYRSAVENFVLSNIQKSPILHLAIHSFTPVLNGEVRNADIGVLYDPSSSVEREIANVIVNEIRERAPHLKVRKNYPYLGKTDGLCTAIRKLCRKLDGACPYAGFEIEINQKMFG